VDVWRKRLRRAPSLRFDLGGQRRCRWFNDHVRRLLVALATIALGGCGSATEHVEVDCERPLDYEAWRKATNQTNGLARGQPERTRRLVAAHLVKCHGIDGDSKRMALKLLGRSGLPDGEPPGDRNTWFLYLGPDPLHIDDEAMSSSSGEAT
jgi:hypothetical protein